MKTRSPASRAPETSYLLRMGRLRSTLHLALMAAVVLSTQSYLTVRVLFEARQGYIARVLCENRDRPELNCDGQCELSRRLAEQDRRDREERTAALELVLSNVPLPTVRGGLEVPSPRLLASAAWVLRDDACPDDPPGDDLLRPPRVA